MTHKNIKRFQTSGTLRSDADIIRTRQNLERILSQNMRESGYIKVLDIDSAWSTSYTNEVWSFVLTLHGIYVGKKEAEQWEGIFAGKKIKRLIPKATSNPSSVPSESE